MGLLGERKKYPVHNKFIDSLCVSNTRVNEKANSFFCLQKRRGHGDGRGLAAMVIGTLDNIRDTRPPPYRILLQTVSCTAYCLG